jgi:hypothetical protein
MGAEGEQEIEGTQDQVSKTSAEMEAWANQQGKTAETAARASSNAEAMPGTLTPEGVSRAVATGGIASTNESGAIEMTKANERGLEVTTEGSGVPPVELRSPSTIAEDARASQDKAA